MRFVSFDTGGSIRPGLILSQDAIIDLPIALGNAAQHLAFQYNPSAHKTLHDLIQLGDPFLQACQLVLSGEGDEFSADAIVHASDVTLVAPIPRTAKNVFCVGKNYAEHVAEGNRAQNIDAALPENPIFFTKPPSAIIGPGAAIRVDGQFSDRIDYEVELAVIIGRTGRDIAADQAHEYIFGYTIVNDVSARDVQRRHGGQFFKGKSFDTSCPMGPHIVTADEVPDAHKLAIQLWVNGKPRQNGSTRDMIFDIPTLIESLSQGLTLEPGDVIATGTPSGVGYAMDPPQFLRDGDEVRCSIEHVGELVNFVVDETSAPN
ncbi:MAG: fumarylacetoacetate hydrolase family protein [Hyphomicrobiaceae bacterium]